MHKVLYASAIPFPNVWANSSQVMKTCEALKRRGFDVHLWAQGKDSPERIFAYYRVTTAFPLRLVPFKNKRERTIFSGHLFYNIRLLRVLSRENSKPDVLYAREVTLWPFLLFGRLLYGIPFVFEAHRMTRRTAYDGLARWLVLRYASALVVISKALQNIVERRYPSTPVGLAYCGVDPERFRVEETSHDIRAKLGIAHDRLVVMYAGSLQEYEGVEILVRAAGVFLSGRATAELYVVGGFDEQIRRLKALVPPSVSARVHYIPHVPYGLVPQYLTAADILVIPLLKNEPGASPVKMFEYLFCSKPVIASRLPVIEEVLTDGANAQLFDAGDSEALAKALERVAGDATLQDTLSRAASRDAAQFTFDARAAHIGRMIEIASGKKSG